MARVVAKNGFTMIPDEIAHRTDLSPLAKSIFGFMVRRARSGVLSVGARYLAEFWGSSKSRVAYAITQLEEAGLIAAQRTGVGKRYTYTVLQHQNKAATGGTLPGNESGHWRDTPATGGTEAATGGTRKRQRPLETKKKISSKPKSKRIEQAERIWKAYPKKVGKQAAMPIIVEALRTTDFKTILAGVQRYAESVAGEDDRFTKHPQGWFRAGRWADEIVASKPRSGRAEAPAGKYPAVEPKLDFGDQP